MTVLAFLALASLQDAPQAATGLVIERTVRSTRIDWLGRRREVDREETIVLRGSDLAVLDRTFGERLIIRPDQKKVWKADPMSREFSVLTFSEVASIRAGWLDELRAVKARVPGTPDEKELSVLLEGYDQFSPAPQVELKASQNRRELVVNGDLVRMTVDIDPQVPGRGYFEALSAIGAFHPALVEKLKGIDGLPLKGTLRYVLFMDRVIDRFEVTSIKRRPIEDVEFDLPPGLTPVPLAGFVRPPERHPEKPAAFRRDAPPPEKKGP
jgi:hypothetical protein